MDMVEDLLENIRNLLEEQLKQMQKSITPGPRPAAGGGADPVGAVQGFIGSISAATAAVLGFVALPPLLTAAVLPFVQALNPGLVQQFNQVLDNLQATIGYAFEPVIAQAALTLREWASMLMPLIRDLRPVMAELAHTVSDVLVSALSFAAVNLRMAMGVLRPVLQLLGMLARVVAGVVEAVSVWMDTIGQLGLEMLGLDDVMGNVTAAIESFKGAIVKCIQGLTMMFVALLKFVGATEAIARFRAGLEKRIAERRAPGGGLVAAPKDVGTGGAEDIARRMAERAFAAVAGAGAARTDTDLLEGILKAVDEASGMDLGRVIYDNVSRALRDAKDATAKAVGGVVSTVADVSTKAAFPALGVLDLARRLF